MTDPRTNEPELSLAEERLIARLRDEANQTRPAYSAALHDRVMRSIGDRAPGHRRGGVRARRAIAWLTAAGVGMAASVAVWFAWPDAGESVPGRPDAGLAAAPAADSAQPPETSVPMVAPPSADKLTALVDATFTRSQWAYLDHDAKLATRMVLDHVPFELPISDAPADGPTKN